MAKTVWMGLDIGTSSAKAVLVDSSGRLVARAGQEYPILSPQPGWAEQQPVQWLAAVQSCAAQVMRESGQAPAAVQGVGLTGQMHSLVTADASGEPLRPAIIWADQRSGQQVNRLSRQIGTGRLAQWTGNPLAAGFMLASWAWLCEHEPQVTRQTRWLMLPKDWVRMQLTGQAGAEPSDASSTLLFDPHTRTWSAPLLALAGIDPGWLPPVSPSAAPAGGLLPAAARACGLLPGTPLVHGCSDVTAQALAQGVIEPGLVSVTVGTGGQLFAALRDPQHDPQLRVHLFCHALPDRWHHEAAVLSAGLALRWLRDQVWQGISYNQLADLASEVEAAQDGLFFLPFLAGERTPYMDPNLRASFTGLTLRHGQPHLVRAVMEGVVFALRQAFDLLRSLGQPIEEQQPLVVSGGAAAHRLWLRLLADAVNQPLWVDDAPEATARGAALLAASGLGGFQFSVPPLQQEAARLVQPDPHRALMYNKVYQDWFDQASLAAGHNRD